VSNLEKWVTLGKIGDTWKNVSHLKKRVTLRKNGSHLEKWVTLGKMGHIFKNGSHLEK